MGRIIASILLVAVAGSVGAADFQGAWESTFGSLSLQRDGKRINGCYAMGNEVCTLEGRVKGRRLIFTYKEPANEGAGWFELAEDGRSFAGKWRQKGNTRWQKWTGKRMVLEASLRGRFDGVWASTFGKMRLIRDIDRVRGLYDQGGGSFIDGTVKKRVLTFRYREAGTEGDGRFTLSADGNALNGRWRADGGKAWQAWNAIRVRPDANVRWLVVVEAPWERNLSQPAYSFGAMLQAFFARNDNVQVRHRFFVNTDGLKRWCREVAFLAEPVILVIASHGKEYGLQVGGRTIGVDAIAEGLRYAANLDLLHFSSCKMMKAELPKELGKRLGLTKPFPVSGYTTTVDWAASAVIEFLYYELILGRGLDPARAAREVRKLLPFAGDVKVSGTSLDAAGFRFYAAPEVKR